MPTLYYKIVNGKKLLVDDQADNSQVNIKFANDIQVANKALWEMTLDNNGDFSFKNRSTQRFIVFDAADGKIKTDAVGGNDNSKFTLTGQGDLAVDKCKIKPKTSNNVFNNVQAKVELRTTKGSTEATEQADQLFKIVYWARDV